MVVGRTRAEALERLHWERNRRNEGLEPGREGGSETTGLALDRRCCQCQLLPSKLPCKVGGVKVMAVLTF